jgi:4-hydroxyacetophenone monooxygenase
VVEESFVRAAVDQAELNVLRMALYQATGNPEIGAIPLETAVVRGGAGTLAVVPEAYRARLKELAVEFLMSEPGSYDLPAPDAHEIDRLILMAEGKPVSASDLENRRGLLCFDEFPRHSRWTVDPPPPIPSGFQVVVIGAGFSGIAMGVQLGLLGLPYVILERRHEVGGVWSTNTYPDARVDTLSATYQFGFEKKYPWTEYFARQTEVRSYVEHVARKYGVFEHINFGHDVKAAQFDDASSSWQLQVATEDGSHYELSANILVSAAGLFAVPREVDIAGAADFEGELLHTTAWSAEHTAKGKRVAVIGNGSTGVQLLARVAEDADHVDIFQRTPQWIAPRERYGEIMTDEARWLTQAMPYYWNWTRYIAVMPLFDARELLVPDAEWIADGGHVNARSDQLRAGLVEYIKAQVGDRPDLIAKLIPDYAPIARRPVVDNGWYRALTRENVELVTAPIERITATGIRTADGVEHELDMIIAAVGFQTGRYLWPTEYLGRDGVSLHDRWESDGAQAHIGMTVPGFPNLFIVYGPNSQPISGGATLPVWFEIWSRYICQAVVAMIEKGATQIEVRKDAHEEYNRRLDDEANRLIYITDTKSRDINYYVNVQGRLGVNVPWDAVEYHRLTVDPDLDDFVIS